MLRQKDLGFFIILISSLAACGLLLWTIYFKSTPQLSDNFGFLSDLNALLNLSTTSAIILGLWFIKQRQRKKHKICMITAFIFSCCFLVSYITYHYYHGDTVFMRQGWLRVFYLTVLISHILLSVVALPLVLVTFYYVFTNKYQKHKAIARYSAPIWLYVSVSGILVYLLLKFTNYS